MTSLLKLYFGVKLDPSQIVSVQGGSELKSLVFLDSVHLPSDDDKNLAAQLVPLIWTMRDFSPGPLICSADLVL